MKNDLLATVPQSTIFESGKNSMEMPDLHDLTNQQPINHDNIQKMKVLESTHITINEPNSETIPLVNEIKEKTQHELKEIQQEIHDEAVVLVDASNNDVNV